MAAGKHTLLRPAEFRYCISLSGCVRSTVAQALQGLGEMGAGLNVLLNNAGSATFGAGGRLDAADQGVSVFDRTSEFVCHSSSTASADAAPAAVALDIRAPWIMTSLCIPALLESKDGACVVNISR
jgi:NAD(P)-dependent dehydrogenase (short-subunit alcohol dehydrogenase family)